MGLEWDGPAGLEWFHLVGGLLGLWIVGAVFTGGLILAGVTNAVRGLELFRASIEVATLVVVFFVVIGERPVLTATLRKWRAAGSDRDARLWVAASLEALALWLGAVGIAVIVAFMKLPFGGPDGPRPSLATRFLGLPPAADVLGFLGLGLLAVGAFVRLVAGLVR